MKADYFSLLSYEPIPLRGIGSIRSPRLREIAQITFPVYSTYLNVLYMDVSGYYRTMDQLSDLYFLGLADEDKKIISQVRREYESLDEVQRQEFSFFDLMLFDPKMRETVLNALNFFLEEEAVYRKGDRGFAVLKEETEPSRDLKQTGEKKPSGFIHSKNYRELSDFILLRSHLGRADSQYENVKVKNQTAEKLLKKLRENARNNQTKPDRKMELANLISAVASRHSSLNLTNIWDLTVYQLYDQVKRLRYLDSYEIQTMNVAAWGNSNGTFDDTLWFTELEESF